MELENGGDGLYVNAVGDFRFPLHESLTSRVTARQEQDGKRMTRIGVRPPYVGISSEKTSDAAFQLPVYASVREAKSTVVTFELTHSFFQAMLDRSVHFRPGEMVWVEIDQSKLYFFHETLELTK